MDTPYQKLAKDFMDLWQKQVASVVSDKQFIHAMLEMFQSMQAPGTYGTAKPTASNPAHAADADHGLLAELAFRLAMCEQRLAALEQQCKKSGRIAKGHSKRSKKPRK